MSSHREAQITGVLTALDQLRCPHRILAPQSPEAAGLVKWIETGFPFLYTQIDWSKVLYRRCLEWQTVDDLVAQGAVCVGEAGAGGTLGGGMQDNIYIPKASHEACGVTIDPFQARALKEAVLGRTISTAGFGPIA